MALTKLDGMPALVVIDLQKGIVSMPTVDPVAGVIGRAAELARAFRERGWPVVLVNVAGGAPGRTETPRPNAAFPQNWAELVEELGVQEGDLRVTKHAWGAFLGTTLDEQLRARGVTQIFLAGVATNVGVESTARSAYDLGYNVVLIVDAMTARDAEAQKNSLERIFPRLGELESTENVLKKLKETEI